MFLMTSPRDKEPSGCPVGRVWADGIIFWENIPQFDSHEGVDMIQALDGLVTIEYVFVHNRNYVYIYILDKLYLYVYIVYVYTIFTYKYYIYILYVYIFHIYIFIFHINICAYLQYIYLFMNIPFQHSSTSFKLRTAKDSGHDIGPPQLRRSWAARTLWQQMRAALASCPLAAPGLMEKSKEFCMSLFLKELIFLCVFFCLILLLLVVVF